LSYESQKVKSNNEGSKVMSYDFWKGWIASCKFSLTSDQKNVKFSRGILHICQKHFCDEGEHSDRHPALQFDDQFSTGIQFRGQYYDFGLYILPEPCEFTTQHVTQCGFIQISLNLLKQCMYIVCHAQNHGCNK
jgi:hypothetical protein